MAIVRGDSDRAHFVDTLAVMVEQVRGGASLEWTTIARSLIFCYKVAGRRMITVARSLTMDRRLLKHPTSL